MALFKFKSKGKTRQLVDLIYPVGTIYESTSSCLLYTSDAADDLTRLVICGRRIS